MKKQIYIGQSDIVNAGRGVFASVDIKKGDVIEICPILILWSKDNEHVMETLLQNYVYEYTAGTTMMALGYGSLYNHRNAPNAKYELVEHEGMPEQNSELYITAIKSIAKNEEICISYGEDFHKTYGS